MPYKRIISVLVLGFAVYMAGSALTPSPPVFKAMALDYYAKSGDCRWYYATGPDNVMYSVKICSDAQNTVRKIK